MSQLFFCLQPAVNGYGSVCHEPCSKTNFLTIYFRWRGGAPLPFWGPSQSFGFSLPPLLVSGDLRLLSTNTCWYPLCDPYSLLTVTFLTGFHCSFQREDSINLTSIVSAGYHVTIYIYIYIYIISWLIIVEGDLKAPFSIATALRCRRACYSFPWIAPRTLDPYHIIPSVKQGGIKYHWVFGMTRPGIESWSSRPLMNNGNGGVPYIF